MASEIVPVCLYLYVQCKDVRILRKILHAQNFAQNRPPCTEFGVLPRIEENLPNGAENATVLLIFRMEELSVSFKFSV